LTTLLGASSAAPPTAMNQLSLRTDNVMMRPSMEMTMMDEVNRRPMDMHQQMPSMRNMYSETTQAFGPNQYFLKDTFGNYKYGYATQNSEKREEGNDQSVQGTYTYIMSNGMKRRVDYIADDQGFHILRDDADSGRFKRSVNPDLINTRMTSFMDSSSLRDDGRDMYRMGQDMSSMMGMDQQRYSNMMDRDMMGRNMMDRDMMSRNMMGRDMMGRNMMDRDMMRNEMMGRRNMYNINQDSGIMRQQMTSNMLGQGMSSNMMYRNMMEDRDMTSNMMNSRMDAYTTEGLMGQQQRMSQQMEMERIPETYISNRFF